MLSCRLGAPGRLPHYSQVVAKWRRVPVISLRRQIGVTRFVSAKSRTLADYGLFVQLPANDAPWLP
jgi:hypothetical protein